MSKNPDKTTPATANAGTEQNIAADVDEVMRKYDRESNTRIWSGWRVEGSFWEWDYDILAPSRHTVAHIAKELWNWTDTYTIEVADPRDALCALMVALAIDAEKCSRNNHT